MTQLVVGLKYVLERYSYSTCTVAVQLVVHGSSRVDACNVLIRKLISNVLIHTLISNVLIHPTNMSSSLIGGRVKEPKVTYRRPFHVSTHSDKLSGVL